MKVAYLISHLAHSGPVNALHDVVAGRLASGRDPADAVVVTLSPERAGSRLPDFRTLGVEVHCVPVRSRRLASGVAALRRGLAAVDPDVCHSVGVKADALLALASPGLRARRLSTVNNVPVEDLGYLYPGARGLLASALHYGALRLLRAPVAACSETVAAHLRRVARVRTHVVLNPVARPRPVDAGDARDLGRLVSAASLDERKNSRTLLARFVGSEACAPLRLAVFGDGPLREELVRAHGADARIAWLGYTRRLAQELAASAAYVSASLSEGMPLTPQLALLCGCPCVLSDIPQHREIAGLSSRVFLFDPASQRSFDAAIAAALRSNERAADEAELAALERRLSPATAAAAYEAIYAALCAGAGATGVAA